MAKTSGYGCRRERVLAFVRERGTCTTNDIREATGLELTIIGSVLTRLRLDGLVENEKVKGSPTTWAATEETDDADDYPVRVTVREWQGSTPRCEFECLLFGAVA